MLRRRKQTLVHNQLQVGVALEAQEKHIFKYYHKNLSSVKHERISGPPGGICHPAGSQRHG